MPYAIPSDPFFSVLVEHVRSPFVFRPAAATLATIASIIITTSIATTIPPPPTPSSYTYISIQTNDDRLYVARCATRAPNRSGGRGDRGEADRWGVAPMLRDPKLSRRATLVECVCVNVSWYWNFLTLLRIRYPYSVLSGNGLVRYPSTEQCLYSHVVNFTFVSPYTFSILTHLSIYFRPVALASSLVPRYFCTD